MPEEVPTWLRETGRLALRYLLVGFAFIPAGILYVALRASHEASLLLLSACLAVGFVVPASAWWISAPTFEKRVRFINELFLIWKLLRGEVFEIIIMVIIIGVAVTGLWAAPRFETLALKIALAIALARLLTESIPKMMVMKKRKKKRRRNEPRP